MATGEAAEGMHSFSVVNNYSEFSISTKLYKVRTLLLC